MRIKLGGYFGKGRKGFDRFYLAIPGRTSEFLICPSSPRVVQGFAAKSSTPRDGLLLDF